MGPTMHFTWRELGNPPPERVSHFEWLAKNLEKVRTAAAAPIVVTSGYRTPEHNARIGGTPFSHHTLGAAVDIRATRGAFADARDLFELMQALIRVGAIEDGGLGSYPGHVHYDLGPIGRRWSE